jgi:alanine racemase
VSLTLTVEGERWRRHLRSVVDQTPGLTPVAKGNGYGLGLARRARKAARLGVDPHAGGAEHQLPAGIQR